MIVLRKGRSLKQLRAPLYKIYRVAVSNGNIRQNLEEIRIEEIPAMQKLPRGRAAFFAYDANTYRLFVAPIPDRDYRAHVLGARLVEL